VELSEFLPSEPKALERDFRKIVRAKPLRAVAEITSNPAYPLFRLIDAILRFSELSQRELEKWVLSLDANATSADPKSSPPSFLEQAILLTCKESGWVGAFTSKAQTFSCVEAPLPIDLRKLDPKTRYLMPMDEAGRFMDNYLKYLDWTVTVGDRIGTAKENVLFIQPLSKKHGWRERRLPLSQTAFAPIRLARLKALHKATAHYSASQLISLGSDNGEATLVVRDENGDRIDLPFVQGSVSSIVAAAFAERWLERDDLIKLHRLAVDYDRDLLIALNQGAEGHATALEVEVPDNFTVTIPLAIAPDGTLASIVEPVN
tara:strand:- start:11871 stop:12824 length:954 start_codon:yes stop_codon:yes gene_type:complete